jgi:predicted RNA-binding Zn-ribbon protein involved in translation (DUF1610 family)
MINLVQSLPPITAVSFACPQCGEPARLKAIEPHPVAQTEVRTFECRECGLPRTYVVKPS